MPARTRPIPKRGRPKGSTSFDPETAQAFGELVRAMRLERGIAQEDLARMADVERSFYSRIERGLSQPSLFVILKIANALDLDSGILVSGVEQSIRERL